MAYLFEDKSEKARMMLQNLYGINNHPARYQGYSMVGIHQVIAKHQKIQAGKKVFSDGLLKVSCPEFKVCSKQGGYKDYTGDGGSDSEECEFSKVYPESDSDDE
tara:strand:- start:169 stop:480 length:312 start_codon:yes stop_codon:yes gene_type:complete